LYNADKVYLFDTFEVNKSVSFESNQLKVKLFGFPHSTSHSISHNDSESLQTTVKFWFLTFGGT
jgi:hypothetical protein